MVLTDKQKDAKRERAQTRRGQGKCANCNNDALPGESRCGDHLQGATQTTINQTASGEGTTHMKKVRLAQLQPNPWQPRTTVDDEYIEKLATDIKSVGRLLQEPLTRPVSEDGYQLAFGHSRIAALRLLHDRKEWPATVMVKVADLTDEEMAYIALSENRARKDLSALEELTAWAKALEIDGVTLQSLADRVNIHQSTMSKNLSVLKLPDIVLEHISDERLALRAARELLCLQTDTHTHKDMIEAVLKDCSGQSTSSYNVEKAPDFRTKTVRASIRTLTSGRSYRGNYDTGHNEQDKKWRPLFERELGDGGRGISFDLEDFGKQFKEDIHFLPEGEDSGGLPWTCQVKPWSTWSARATREQTKAEEEKRPSNSKNGTGAKLKPEPKPKGSKWLQAIRQDPVVTALVDTATLRKIKADKDVESLPDEIRKALGTRILKVGNRYDSSVNALPGPAQPIKKGQEQYGRGDTPPMFDFSGCATCTDGASWEEEYAGSGVAQLFCVNKQAYMDKQSVGIEKFLVWRDEIAARNREEDLRLGMELASVLSPGMAKVVILSLLVDAQQAGHVQTWNDGRGERYDIPAAAGEQFAAMVGCALPRDYNQREQWGEYLEEFAAKMGDDALPQDFDYPSAAAWLVMWQARLNAGFQGELTAMAMAMAAEGGDNDHE